MVVEDATADQARSPASFESDSWDQMLDQTTAENKPQEKPQRKVRHPEDLQATVPNQSQGFGDLANEKKSGKPAGKRNAADAGEKSVEKHAANGAAKQSSRPEGADSGKASSSIDGRATQWQSQKSRQQKTILLGIILGVGVLLSGGALTYYLLTTNSQPTQTAEGGGADSDAQTSDPADPAAQPSPEGDGVPGENTGPAENTTDEQNKQVEDSTTESGNTATDTQPNAPIGDGNQPRNQNGGTVENDPLIDPVDSDTNNGEAVAAGEPSNDGPVPPSNQSLEDVMNQIFSDDDIFQQEALQGPSLPDSSAEGASPFGDVVVDETGIRRRRSARIERPAPRLVDAPQQLSAEIAGVHHEGASVLDLISVLERITSVPIWIDGDAMQALPVDLNVKQPVQVVKTSAEQILVETLSKFNMSVARYSFSEEQPNALGLVIFPEKANDLWTVEYRVPGGDGPLAVDLSAAQTAEEDTAEQEQAAETPTSKPNDPLGNVTPDPEPAPAEPAENDTTATEFASLMQQFVPAAWQPAEEMANAGPVMQVQGDKIQVTANAMVQAKLQRLLGQLDLYVNNGGLPARDATISQPLAALNEQPLQQVLNMNFYTATPLRKVLAEFTAQTGVSVIIDWPALLQEGWTPDTIVPWVCESTPAAEALDELVFDMGLAYRSVSPNVLQLSTQSSLDENLDIEVYPVGDLLQGLEQWPFLRSRLGQMLHVEMQEFPSTYTNYYPDWNCVIAKLPQEGHRRLREYFAQIRQLIAEKNQR